MANLCCLLAVTLLWARVEAIPTQTNVDVEEPSIIISPATSGGDGFGWEAIFHHISPLDVEQDTMAQAVQKTRILIGAPRGSYQSGGLGLEDPGLPALDDTGLVYSCSIGSDGSCEGVRGDTSLYIGGSVNLDITNGFQTNPPLSVGTANNFFVSAIAEGKLFDQAPNSPISDITLERKQGQLMGSVLYSSGDLVMACASRWTTSLGVTDPTTVRDETTGDFIEFDSSQPRGICFVGNRDLTGFKTFFPCVGSGNSMSSGGNGYCSAGFSAAITSDQIVHIGAPGHELFSGSVFTRQFSDDIEDNFEEVDVIAESPPDTTPLYFGYDMTLGYVRSMRSADNTGPGPSDVAVSSTRFDNRQNYNGRVFVYSVGTASSPPSNPLLQDILGTQMAEFFGYSLALCDLTGDGYDELVVGAPMYSTVSPMVAPEQGRVYIYLNLQGNFDLSPTVLSGAIAYGRFGFSVANVGDLDADGRQDLAIGAPYERSSSENAGAVYIYYGKSSMDEFEGQVPQKIHADNIVSQTTSLPMLTNFGFSLSGNVDVDNNRHSDLLAGSPADGAVIVLRTRPFINIIVNVEPAEPVNLDNSQTFSVMVTATYNSANIEGMRTIPFTLREILDDGEEPRLELLPSSAINVAEGTFVFENPNEETTATVMVTATLDVSDLTSPYRLQLDVDDIDRVNPSPVSGQQALSDLSDYPRLRLQGNTTLQVEIIDPCGDDGCISDVVLQPIMPSQRRLVAAEVPTSIQHDIVYLNNGPEEARDLRLNITDVPTRFFTGLSLSSSTTNFPCSPLQLDPEVEFESVQCFLQNRSRDGEMQRLTLTLFVTSTFIGDEENFDLNVEILVNTEGDNMDNVTSNNEQSIQFTVDSEADLGINLRFTVGNGIYHYSGVQPSSIGNSADLGDRVTLSAEVTNSGQSVIQSARLLISFPAQDPAITGSNYFLYPSSISIMPDEMGRLAGTIANCNATGLDPDNLDSEPPVQTNRRKRTINSVNIKNHRTRRNSIRKFNPETGRRTKREALGLNCGTQACVTFTCDIEILTTAGLFINVEAVVDERFYSREAESRTYCLNATASVSVTSDFQVAGDDPGNNAAYASATVSLRPDPNPDEPNLVHVILWPVIGGVIILVVLFILLYFVGFFRRKKKPGEEKIEGDFDAPPATSEKVALSSYEKPTEEATTV